MKTMMTMQIQTCLFCFENVTVNVGLKADSVWFYNLFSTQVFSQIPHLCSHSRPLCVWAAVVGESGGRALRLPVTSSPSPSGDGADGLTASSQRSCRTDAGTSTWA